MKYRNAFLGERPRHDSSDLFSIRHPKMELSQRAKIFSPFDALKGFGEAIAGKRETYVEKRNLSEDEQAGINQALTVIVSKYGYHGTAHENPVTATALYFVPCADENHEAYGVRGRYKVVKGTVRKVDLPAQTLKIGETTVSFSDLLTLEIDIAEEGDGNHVLSVLHGDITETEANY